MYATCQHSCSPAKFLIGSAHDARICTTVPHCISLCSFTLHRKAVTSEGSGICGKAQCTVLSPHLVHLHTYLVPVMPESDDDNARFFLQQAKPRS